MKTSMLFRKLKRELVELMGALSIGEIMRNRELIKTIEKLSALLRKVT